ncbi:GAF and ANTAR domain-containing protein [Mycolicibacterium hodleri]|uniref:ANTAR domain-containing protein n=1 Tax=Mycolicibacterium hodleri TaxID=49897 RepID=A0A502EEZ3_9MYCO|nr:ANTAR domain-containing protein [Mycolicibacterium hodleri]TPG35589.1 ANTAR domain-containing protein [Mycolicibacterium hodleri]
MGFIIDATPQGARARFLAAVSRLESEQKAPALLCKACVEALPVQRAAIAVHVDGAGLEVLCASDGIAEQVEWTQITLGEGPGVESIAAGTPMVESDLADPHGRWPTFAADAVKCGVYAVDSLPLEVGAIRVGVLDLYRDSPGALSAKDFADALAVADLVTAVLLTVGRDGQITESLGPWWDQPLSTREVHQATGMIVAQLGVTAHEAYVRMQGFAYAQGRMLSDVANAVVYRRLRFDTNPDGDPDEVAQPLRES